MNDANPPSKCPPGATDHTPVASQRPAHATIEGAAPDRRPRDPGRVILIGGAPLSGKTTTARSIGRQLGAPVVSTDHLGEAARAVTTAATHADLHAFDSSDHVRYYTSHSPAQLLEHALAAHRALWPAVEAVIRRHLTWAERIVIEGWALLPDLVAQVGSPDLRSVWIEAPEPVLRSRLQADSSFLRGALDPTLLIERFVGRSVDLQSWLRQRAGAGGLPYVVLSGSESPEEASRLCLHALGITPAGSGPMTSNHPHA